MQNPLDESRRQEITNLAKAMLETFSVQYVLGYKTALVQKVIEDKQAEPPEFWELPDRPPNTEPIRTGYLVKRGEVVKNWKKRWFVVRHDYVVEYYESQEKWKAGAKPKGRVLLSGFQVEMDPNSFAKKWQEEFQKQLNIDEPVADKKDFKPFTIELYHPSRRCWYMVCENEEEFKSWGETFKSVCWRSPMLANDDPVAQAAFEHAVRETRWALGRWGWWGYGGTEEDILSDMVSEHINYAVLGGVWSSIDGAPKIRCMLRETAEKTVAGIIRGLVGPAWKAVAASIVTLRPKLEEGIKSQIGPVIDAQQSITGQARDKTMDKLQPALGEHVYPHVSKIGADILVKPLVKGFGLLIKSWETKIDEVAAAGTGDVDALSRDLKRWATSWWSINEAYYAVREIQGPLSLLGKITSGVDTWGLIYDLEQQMEKLLDNAMYDFETQLREKASAADARAKTLEKLKKDCVHAVNNALIRIPFDIVMPVLNEHILGPFCELIKPIEDLIPGPLKDFVSVTKCLENYVTDSVRTVIESVVTAPGIAGTVTF